MESTAIKCILGLISAGVIVTPMFVLDRISAHAEQDRLLYATREKVTDLDTHLVNIRNNQKIDHDILIRMSERIGIKNGRSD